MPPKKRKLALPAKVGKIRQYLTDNFSIFPEELKNFKNGHVLLQYIINDSSRTKTIMAVMKKLPSCVINLSQLQSLLTQAKKFKNLRRDSEMEKYASLCNQLFNPVNEDPEPETSKLEHFDSPKELEPQPGTSQQLDPQPGTSQQLDPQPGTSQQLDPQPGTSQQLEPQPGTSQQLDPQPGTSQQLDPKPGTSAQLEPRPQRGTSEQPIDPQLPKTPRSSSSNRSSPRQGLLTPRKLKLKKRLEYLSQTRSTMKLKYKNKIAKLRREINYQSLHKVKYLNQVITRKDLSLKKKDNKIKRLRVQFSKTVLAKELAETKKKLKNSRRNNKRLQNVNKKRCSSEATDDVEFQKLQDEVNVKTSTIIALENENLCLQETVESLQLGESKLQKEGKVYSPEMRMLVYDAVVNHVPTKNVPTLIQQFARRSGVILDKVPHRNTVEMMTRELGVISDFQAAEILLQNQNITLGFDATTQEGVHVNSVHITTQTTCHILDIDQLAGGTSEDYALHIEASIQRINDVYCQFYSTNFSENRKKILNNISNTMSDRAAVNHATIQRLELSWRKSLNELNCHLHPLDTIASKTRSTLKIMEPADVGKKLWGTESLSHQLVLAVNKLRYKDGRGDPKGFKTYLDNAGLPRGLIPRYRGNRLRIMFHICGKLHSHRDFFLKMFEEGTVTCGGLLGGIRQDFLNPCSQVEIQILGLIGKLLSGPWMATFYTSSESPISHIDGITIVKEVVALMKKFSLTPLDTLSTTTDFFGNELKSTDETLGKLQQKPADDPLFETMMGACLSASVSVLEKQYERYFGTDLTDKLRTETESARCHNIDAEEIMGMFSASKERAPNATMCYLSSRIRAQKNKVVDFLDNLEEEKRAKLIEVAITLGRKHRQERRKKSREIQAEICKRLANKLQKQKTKDRQKLDRLLRSCDTGSLDLSKQNEFGDLGEDRLQTVKDIIGGKIVGHKLSHIWYDEDTQEKTVYFGKVEKLLKRNGGTYRIGYWKEDQLYDDDAEDFDLSKYTLAVDFICEDLILS
ncbi:uncharacterized protein [Asterias amurensis]|uniref:uncharacterized protein n=1 Tax=Asterias amurensis TaxID=7602 RepID=UPI003AB6E634